MAFENYKENKRKILEIGIPNSIIFDYENDSLRKVYDQYFLWCEENLRDYSNRFKLGPCYFFYWNTSEANAGAATDGKNSFIRFSKGYMEQLHERVGTKNKFFKNSKFTGYHNLQSGISDSLEYLLFQCSTIFTFYHEFAHCVQKQSSSLNERPENRSYSLYHHVCEYDADLNGAQFVSMYMQQYYTDMLPSAIKNEKNFKRLMYMGISSIVITFLLFLNGEFDSDKLEDTSTTFYTKASTHPHTYVRLYYVINHYVKNAKANGVKIDFQDTFNSVNVLCNEFFNGTDILKDFITGIKNHFDEIRKYEMELYQASLNSPFCIRHKVKLFM
ncbi:hypothetical protein [Flavobacterium pectinovorum]|uniref:Peptidase U49 n=1 Tax=Flavobacterium pectinovorum TaxID=29533 RepID=A0A502F7J5_9FLAO|nr:hypothetical protein [Flavobacterium pectinovorum]TPG45333.1 hypothetical protein EAH81_01660 [Flavobacterium pectinovorum]